MDAFRTPGTSKKGKKGVKEELMGDGFELTLTRLAGLFVLLFGIIVLLSDSVYKDGTYSQKKYTDVFASGVLMLFIGYTSYRAIKYIFGEKAPDIDQIVKLMMLSALVIYIYYSLVFVTELQSEFLIALGIMIALMVFAVVVCMIRYARKRYYSHQMETINMIILILVTINFCMLISSPSGPSNPVAKYMTGALPIVLFGGIMIFNWYFIFSYGMSRVVIVMNDPNSSRTFMKYIVPQLIAYACAVALFITSAASDRYDKGTLAGMGTVLGAALVSFIAIFIGHRRQLNRYGVDGRHYFYGSGQSSQRRSDQPRSMFRRLSLEEDDVPVAREVSVGNNSRFFDNTPKNKNTPAPYYASKKPPHVRSNEDVYDTSNISSSRAAAIAAGEAVSASDVAAAAQLAAQEAAADLHEENEEEEENENLAGPQPSSSQAVSSASLTSAVGPRGPPPPVPPRSRR